MYSRKAVSLNVRCGQKRKIVEAPRENLIYEIRKAMKVGPNIVLEQHDRSSGKWHKVTPYTVKDVSEIRVRDLDNPNADNEDKEAAHAAYLKKLQEKLVHNSPLSTENRVFLVKLLSNSVSKEVPSNNARHDLPPDCETDESQKAGDRRIIPKSTAEVGIQTDMPRYLDTTPLIDFLKSQARLGSDQNEEMVDQVMRATYRERRDFIYHKCPTVRSVQDSYPTLFGRKQLLVEFGLVTGTDVVTEFFKNLSVHSPAILKYAPQSCAAMKVFMVAEKIAKTEKEKQYVTTAGALLALPSLFREHITCFIEFKSKYPSSCYPTIICKSSMKKCLEKTTFKIYAEEVKLCETSDLTEAFLILMAAHYIFDISYPNNGVQTATLIEKLLLGLEPDPKNLTAKVREIYEMVLQ